MVQELQQDQYRFRHVALPPQSERPLVLDLGANVGMVAVLLARIWPRARIIAVEPAPANFRYLAWNIRANHVAAQVWPLNLAVGSSGGESQSFYYSPTQPTKSQACGSEYGCPRGTEDDSWRGGDADWQVAFKPEMATLAELLAALDASGPVHLLKVDCEGCEWEVFAPGSWKRLRHRVRHVAAELHGFALPNASGSGGSDLEAAVESAVCVHRVPNVFPLCTTM